MNGGGEVVEGVATLLAAGLDNGEHRFYEAAAVALCVPKESLRQMTA